MGCSAAYAAVSALFAVPGVYAQLLRCASSAFTDPGGSEDGTWRPTIIRI